MLDILGEAEHIVSNLVNGKDHAWVSRFHIKSWTVKQKAKPMDQGNQGKPRSRVGSRVRGQERGYTR